MGAAQAWLIGGRADYSWDQPPGADCPTHPGFNPAAGRNTNRTRSSFTPTGGTPTTTHACYNTADQLVSTTTGTATTSYRYDERGNQVADGQDLYTWDAADRLVAITAPGTTVAYTRDALDRPVSRQQGTTITRYAYSGFDDTPVAVLDASHTTTQELIGLPGGVLVTVGLPGLAETLSFPDLAGNYVTATGTTGDPVGPRAHYDPWGARQPPGPAIDNTAGAADFAAYGAHGKLNEHATTKPLVLMGARPLSPTHGRFLTVDPIEGGCANNYVYVYGDPVNTTDLTGKEWWNPLSWTACGIAKAAGTAARALGGAAIVVGTGAVIFGTGGLFTAGFGIAATGASAAQWWAGSIAGDRAAARSGMVGTTVGVLTLGTWGAVSKGLYGADKELSNQVVARAGMYANTSRFVVSEAAGSSNKDGC